MAIYDYETLQETDPTEMERLKKKFAGNDPKILALPKTFKIGAVHLCIKDEGYNG